MEMKVKSKVTAAIAVMIMCAVTLAALFMGGGLIAYAESPVSGTDGTYSVPIDTSDAGMGASYLTSTGTIEKSGENYYFAFGHENALTNLRIADENGLRTGYTSYAEGGVTYYVYTLSASRLQGSLSFTAYIPAMDMDVSFSISLDLANATRTGDYVDVGERPAEYVPVIETSAGSSYTAEKGTVFTIPSATATLGDEVADITYSAYYVNGEDREEVEITNGNQITLSNAGEYHVVYKASSTAYTTSLGNPAYTEYDVKIISKIGATALAKFEDKNAVLPEGTALQASEVTEGTIYDRVKERMKSIADNYRVVSVGLYDATGREITPNGEITLYVQPDSTFNRNETVVYYMTESGELTEISCNPYGRYVRFDTDKTGTFIVCIPGVAFIMPIWGYITIACVCIAVVVAAAAAITVVVIRKRKKRKAEIDETAG